MVLVATSPFFMNILKRNKHPHPLIYMRGGKPENHGGLFLSWRGKCLPRTSRIFFSFG